MSAPQNVIAVVFDFDDTLTDDSTTKLLSAHGIDTNDFWKNKANKLVDEGWNPTLAYLNLILDHVGKERPLGYLRNKDLRDFGNTLKFYPGVMSLFKELQAQAAKHEASHPSVEFYVITGGLEEVVKGSKIEPFLHGIWGCRFAEGMRDGRKCIDKISNAVTFTEKTKHLFEINKGLVSLAQRKAYAVNEGKEESDRRIPFPNMLYVGDGLTDVPCFSLLSRNGGRGFGVFDPTRDGSPKQAWQRLIAPKRVTSVHSPKYGKRDDLGALIRAAVDAICLKLDLRTQTA